MPNIVILGSLDEGEYKVTFPKIFSEEYHTDHERGYEISTEIFYPAIDEADAVIVYAPKGLKKKGHTLVDVRYALKQDKIIYSIGPFPERCCRTCFWGRPARGMLGCYFDYRFRTFVALALGEAFSACDFGNKSEFTRVNAAWSPKMGGVPWEGIDRW